jgi:hypothetical protein
MAVSVACYAKRNIRARKQGKPNKPHGSHEASHGISSGRSRHKQSGGRGGADSRPLDNPNLGGAGGQNATLGRADGRSPADVLAGDMVSMPGVKISQTSRKAVDKQMAASDRTVTQPTVRASVGGPKPMGSTQGDMWESMVGMAQPESAVTSQSLREASHSGSGSGSMDAPTDNRRHGQQEAHLAWEGGLADSKGWDHDVGNAKHAAQSLQLGETAGSSGGHGRLAIGSGPHEAQDEQQGVPGSSGKGSSSGHEESLGGAVAQSTRRGGAAARGRSHSWPAPGAADLRAPSTQRRGFTQGNRSSESGRQSSYSQEGHANKVSVSRKQDKKGTRRDKKGARGAGGGFKNRGFSGTLTVSAVPGDTVGGPSAAEQVSKEAAGSKKCPQQEENQCSRKKTRTARNDPLKLQGSQGENAGEMGGGGSRPRWAWPQASSECLPGILLPWVVQWDMWLRESGEGAAEEGSEDKAVAPKQPLQEVPRMGGDAAAGAKGEGSAGGRKSRGRRRGSRKRGKVLGTLPKDPWGAEDELGLQSAVKAIERLTSGYSALPPLAALSTAQLGAGPTSRQHCHSSIDTALYAQCSGGRVVRGAAPLAARARGAQMNSARLWCHPVQSQQRLQARSLACADRSGAAAALPGEQLHSGSKRSVAEAATEHVHAAIPTGRTLKATNSKRFSVKARDSAPVKVAVPQEASTPSTSPSGSPGDATDVPGAAGSAAGAPKRRGGRPRGPRSSFSRCASYQWGDHAPLQRVSAATKTGSPAKPDATSAAVQPPTFLELSRSQAVPQMRGRAPGRGAQRGSDQAWNEQSRKASHRATSNGASRLHSKASLRTETACLPPTAFIFPHLSFHAVANMLQYILQMHRGVQEL